MRNKSTVINTIPPSADYPMGRIKNDTGVNDGTPIVEENNGDIMETVTFFMNRSKTTPNGLPDNVTNGYQIANAIRETGGKFDVIHDMEVVSGKINVNFKLDNIYNGEFIIAKFNSLDDTQFVTGINKILGSDSIEFNAELNPDFNGNFFNTGRYIIEKTSDFFDIYPIATKSILSNIYERLETLEIYATNNMRILDSGIYVDSTSRASGAVVITHDVVDVNNTKLIVTCTREDAMSSLTTTNFTYLVTDRSVNNFRLAFNNFPSDVNNKLRVEWVLVNS